MVDSYWQFLQVGHVAISFDVIPEIHADFTPKNYVYISKTDVP